MTNNSHLLELEIADSNEDMSDVLATWGHEIRNPLSALCHALEIWHDAMQNPHEMEELRAVIERQVRQLRMLSAEVMDAAHVTHEKLAAPTERVNLKSVINDACEEVHPFIWQCDHTLNLTQCREPITVVGDSSRLLQVFANLIQNAAKFTDPGGTLAVTVVCRDGIAEVRIRDNGRGIEPHFLPRIFERFTQAPGRGNDGVGLGLGLVQAIVQRHGGTVSVQSEGLGHGSEFTVRLPLREEQGEVPRETPAESVIVPITTPAMNASLRILVVDDNPCLRMLMARLLGNLGHSVTVAEDGETAIRMALHQRPQVLFIDLMMPGIDGYEVARQLRPLPELQNLFLIALSGSGGDATRQRALEAGFDQYLLKPADINEIVATLAKVPVRPAVEGEL